VDTANAITADRNGMSGLHCEGCGEWVDTTGTNLEPDILRQGEYNGHPGRVSIVVFLRPAESDGRFRGELAHQCALGAYLPEGQIAPPKAR
jgi:hypothetical protein